MEPRSKADAPRFASFKPKASGKTSQADTTLSQKDEKTRNHSSNREDRPKRRHRARSRSRSRERHHRHPKDKTREPDEERKKRHRSRSRSPSRHIRTERNRDGATDRARVHQAFRAEHTIELTPPTSSLFEIDRKGDALIKTYGSNHRGHIPEYRRTGYGYVMGMSHDARIDRNNSSDRFMVFESKSQMSEQRGKSALSVIPNIKEQELRFVLPDRQKGKQDQDITTTLKVVEDVEFLHLKEPKLRSLSAERTMLLGQDLDYRSIEGTFKGPPGTEDSDVESVQSEQQEANHWLQTKTKAAELTRRAKDEPENLKAWQDLILHQEQVLRMNRSEKLGLSHLSGSEQRSLAEIRMSIYNQALQKITKQSDREQLLLGHIGEASAIWDQKKVAERWDDMLKSNPSSVPLWSEYLNHAQTTFRGFNHSHCLATFSRCLKILSQVSSAEHVQEMQIYVFLRLTVFLLETGFIELSIALWQAVLELHLNRPPDLASPSEALELLGEFWDSEVERMGESGAKGWCHFHKHGGDPREEVNIKRDINIDSSKSCFADFASAELLLEKELGWPGRAGDEVWDDPYHLVMFSDLKPWLELLPNETSFGMLLEAFLLYNGFPPTASTSYSGTRNWHNDTFLSSNSFHSGPNLSLISNPTSAEANIASRWTDNKQATFNATTDTEQLFKVKFSARTGLDGAFLECMPQILNAFMAVLPANAVLAEYYLAFKCRNGSSPSKLAKALLKASPNSLRLYNAYALAEKSAGQIDKAESIWKTALSVAHTLSEKDQADIPLLWYTYTMSALDENNVDEARIRVVRGANPSAGYGPIEPSEYLKASRILQEACENCIDTQKPIQLVYNAMLLILLKYLQHPDIDVILTASTSASTFFATANQPIEITANELYHQLLAQLLQLHAAHHPTKPQLVQTHLLASLRLFPQNTILLNIYQAHEQTFSLEDRLRGSLHSLPFPTTPTITSLLHSLLHELHRTNTGTGTIHSALAAFERAVESPNGRHSRELWTLFVRFVLEHRKPEEARKVFLRGMLRLPWCKGFLMMAFTELREVLGFEECRRVYEFLVEGELRVWVDLGEILSMMDARSVRGNA